MNILFSAFRFSFILILKYSFFAVIAIASACSYFQRHADDNIIARAYDDILTNYDIIGLVPSGTAPKDSAEIVRNYIENWLRQKAIIHKAEKNLNNEQKDFSKQLEDYRNSLIIYTFENELIRQKLDTNITDSDIEDFYNNNSEEFGLKENIVRVVYVKTFISDPANKKLRYLYKSDRETDKQLLMEISAKSAVNSFLDDEKWLYFKDLLKEIPIETYDQDSYIRNHRYIEFQDSVYSYFINIKGFRIKEGIAPLNLVRDNIRSLIINQRKINLVKQMEDDVYNSALKKGDLKIISNKNN